MMISFPTDKRHGLVLYGQLVRTQKKQILSQFALLAMSVGVQTPIPFLISRLIDGFSRQVNFSELVTTIIWIGGLSMLGVILSMYCQIHGATITKRFLMKARLKLFSSLQRAPLMFVRSFGVSDLHTRLSRDIGALNYLSPAGLAGVARDICFVLIFGGILISLNVSLLLWLAVLLPIAALIFKFVGRQVAELSSLSHVAYASSNAKLLESISCMREALLADTQSFHHERLAQSLDKSEEALLKVRTHSASMFGILGLIPVIAVMMIWTVGGLQIEESAMSVGQVVSFFVVLTMMYGPINSLFSAASGYAYEKAAFMRLTEIYYGTLESLGPFNDNTKLNSTLELEKIRYSLGPAKIELREIAFSYGSEIILERFSFTIVAGRCTSITGPNGIGKSTLLSIILGLSPPAEGEVILNEHLLDSHVGFSVFAKFCGYLPQDVFVYNDTLRTNITLGRDISDAQIYAAANELGLVDFLDAWPLRLDARIFEAGHNLSGGEKQKIGLLRATVNRPTLLVLDEPENNLDKASINGLIAYLDKLKGRCTVVMVTHGNAFDDVVDAVLDIS